MDLNIVLKNFDNPDIVRNFEKGKFEIVTIGGMTIGRATYEPGWKWSKHVSPLSGTKFCEVEHLGMVLSGSATAAFEKRRESRSRVLSPILSLLLKSITLPLYFLKEEKYFLRE